MSAFHIAKERHGWFLQACATAGTSEMREEAAQALLVACKHNFSDPEVQQQLMEVLAIQVSTHLFVRSQSISIRACAHWLLTLDLVM